MEPPSPATHVGRLPIGSRPYHRHRHPPPACNQFAAMPRVHAPTAAEAKAHPREFAILKQLATNDDVTSEVGRRRQPLPAP
jgi:hypothetical protein